MTNWKQGAALVARPAALGAALLAALPARAWDLREQQSQPYSSVFIRIPLDGSSAKERLPVWGFALRGKRDYEYVSLDSQDLTRFVEMGFIESKVVLVGVLAAGGALAVAASGSKSAATQQQQQQEAQAKAAASGQLPQAPACPTPVTNPCR